VATDSGEYRIGKNRERLWQKYPAGTRQTDAKNWGLVWRNIKKISQIINDYFNLPFFLLIILWCWWNVFVLCKCATVVVVSSVCTQKQSNTQTSQSFKWEYYRIPVNRIYDKGQESFGCRLIWVVPPPSPFYQASPSLSLSLSTSV
jgi:hypothetical protein